MRCYKLIAASGLSDFELSCFSAFIFLFIKLILNFNLKTSLRFLQNSHKFFQPYCSIRVRLIGFEDHFSELVFRHVLA